MADHVKQVLQKIKEWILNVCRNPREHALLILSVVLILLAGVFTVENVVEARVAEQRAQQLLEETKLMFEPLPEDPAPESSQAPAEEGMTIEDIRGTEPEEPENTFWDENPVDGMLGLPDLGIELPILTEYKVENLRITGCIFYGTGGDHPDQMVVAAHNYKNHFGRVDELEVGATVTWCSTGNWVKTDYRISEIVEIDADAPEDLLKGDWDITLLTCNFDNSKRILVRCVEA